MLKNFINKPVLATVISILLVILGLIGLFKLPLQQFPDIAPPTIMVTAHYPGANAETILRSVAPPLEEAINGVEGITYISSTASNDGSLVISVFFKLGTNPDQAAVNVQNRVSQATSQLPPEVVQQGIVTGKQQNSLIMVTALYSEDTTKFDETFVNNYASINIIPDIKRVPGVASAVIFGGAWDYSMRIWLNPGQLQTYHITPAEVTAAIQDKSLEAAPGRFGDRSNEAFEYVIRYKGKLNNPEQYENIPIRANSDGSILRLKDVARIEFGSYDYSHKQRLDGHVGAGIVVSQLPGSNANDIQIAVNKLMENAAKNFPKGIAYNTFVTTKKQMDMSIDQVKHTLFEAFILVFLVVYLFLQDFRSTLIPAIAVPVAIIGTFFFMYIFGFTINLLTLFALVLAIGIVVDDAIVVVEAVHSKMEHHRMPASQATLEAMHEITGAIVSITLVMAAVFLPVGFLEGSTGVFYRQFAFTMAIAIVISSVNALTLSPALAALFLKNPHMAGQDGQKKNLTFKEKFFAGFNVKFNQLNDKYIQVLRFLLKRKWVAIGGLLVVVAACGYLLRKTPTGFIPTEDQGFIAIAVSMPPGTSLHRTEATLLEAEKKLMQLDAYRFTAIIPGFDLLTSATSPSAATIFFLLKDSKDRGKIKDIDQLIGVVNQTLSSVKGGVFFAFNFPTVPGFSNVEALDVVLFFNPVTKNSSVPTRITAFWLLTVLTRGLDNTCTDPWDSSRERRSRISSTLKIEANISVPVSLDSMMSTGLT